MNAPVVLSHAEQNAKSYLETIELWHEVYSWAYGNDDPSALSWAGRRFLIEDMDWTADPDREAVAEAISDMVREDPLSVEVREDWHEVGEESEMAQYRILISTGGPALRMVGALAGTHAFGPDSARLQHQDWGTPWTDYISPGSSDALIWYAWEFYWGD